MDWRNLSNQNTFIMKDLNKITKLEINLLAIHLHNSPLPFLLDADQPGHQYHHEAQDLRVRPFLPDPILLQFPQEA